MKWISETIDRVIDHLFVGIAETERTQAKATNYNSPSYNQLGYEPYAIVGPQGSLMARS
jgi:hypothetical protein